MTAPLAFRRESADVQAWRLDSYDAMRDAQWRLHEHGIPVLYDANPHRLTLLGAGLHTTARLGDWLTYDGEQFAVEADDGGKPSGHTKVEGEG